MCVYITHVVNAPDESNYYTSSPFPRALSGYM